MCILKSTDGAAQTAAICPLRPKGREGNGRTRQRRQQDFNQQMIRYPSQKEKRKAKSESISAATVTTSTSSDQGLQHVLVCKVLCEPVQTFVQSGSVSCTAGLHKPLAVGHARKTKFLG